MRIARYDRTMNVTVRPVILLEDDSLLRALWAEGLSEAGFSVVPAANVAQAEAALQAVEGRAVLVADRTIEPGAPNGFQFAADALERFADLRVLYISGTHIAVRRRALGARERALLKPFAMAQMLAAARELSQ